MKTPPDPAEVAKIFENLDADIADVEKQLRKAMTLLKRQRSAMTLTKALQLADDIDAFLKEHDK